MRWTLAFRHFVVRPGRSLVLLFGYSLGVAVMIVLLSVGDAMLMQSRDASLVGGGELTALPEGIDVEAMRTGGLTGMFHGIDRARFVTRQLLGGPRHESIVRAVSPQIEEKRITLTIRDSAWVVRAGADLPTIAAAGRPLKVIAGTWGDAIRDAAWANPDDQRLYDELDRFHMPPGTDSTWGEWHYFNVAVDDDEWWYITLLVGGDIRGGRWGGQVIVSRRAPDGHRRFTTTVPHDQVRLDTTRADLRVGPAAVVQREGRYRLTGSSGAASFDLELVPAAHAYFPPVELRSDAGRSGYVVPALRGTASGRVCISGRCREIEGASAYHDHNWGTWSGVTWEWGTGTGQNHTILYGGVISLDGSLGAGAPFFLAIADSMGLAQVLRFSKVTGSGHRHVPGTDFAAPADLRIIGTRESDTVQLRVAVADVQATRSSAGAHARHFLQMRGWWTIAGTVAGRAVSDSGYGFFETWIAPAATTARPGAPMQPPH